MTKFKNTLVDKLKDGIITGSAGDQIAKKIKRSDSMKFWNKMKKNTKGFTLVEIIVVLVILAVLAAFTIPTMLGFVNEAKGKALIAEAREVYVAAQATVTEYQGGGTSMSATTLLDSVNVGASPAPTTGASATMLEYLSSDITISTAADLAAYKTAAVPANAFWEVTVNAAGKVTNVEYTRNGYTVTINAGGQSTVNKIS
ncbi:type II secretion system protein [Eubacteriaceae bacterium ES3]|nr:type II secretion system protein [Eubacteriaceae bacterium ES3]